MAKIILIFIFSFPIWLQAQKINNDSVRYLLPDYFAGQIAIKKDSNFIYTENFGPKERTFGTLINDSTVFNIGQISHTIVHYFITNLVSLGQIKTTDKVSTYINNFPYKDIQIKHLLEHQSGLPLSYVKLYHRKVYNNWNLKLTERETRFNNDDILSILIKEKPKLKFYPGDSTEYSDLNYLILTSLIEKVTFSTLRNFTSKTFKNRHFNFQPILSANKDSISNGALGYRVLTDSSFHICGNLATRGMPFDDGTYGNQHIYLSAKNLTLWGQFILENNQIDSLKDNPTKEILGGIKFDTELQVILKQGSFGATSSILIISPNNGLIIAINSTAFNPLENGKEFHKLINYFKKIN